MHNSDKSMYKNSHLIRVYSIYYHVVLSNSDHIKLHPLIS